MKNQILALAFFLFGGVAMQAQSVPTSTQKTDSLKKVELSQAAASTDDPAEKMKQPKEQLAKSKSAKSCCAAKGTDKAKAGKGKSCCASKSSEAAPEKTAKSAGCASKKGAKSCCSGKASAKKT